MTGRITRRVDMAVIPIRRSSPTTSTPAPQPPSALRIWRPTTTNGSPTASNVTSILTKKLSHGLWRVISNSEASGCEGTILNAGESPATVLGRRSSAGFLSSTIGLTRSLPARVGELGGELSLSSRRGGDLLRGGGHGAAALGDVLDGQQDLLGGGALLLAGQLHLAADLGDRSHHGEPTLHLLDAFLQRHDSLAALGLSPFDELGDLGCGRLRTLGQPAYLVGDDRKTSARVARAGGFDGGIESEEVGLVGDVVDELEDAFDLVDAPGQGERSIARGPEVGLSKLQVGLRLGGLDGDPIDRVGDGCRRAGDLLHARRRRGGGGELAGRVGDLASKAEKHSAEALDHGVEGVPEPADLPAAFEADTRGEISSFDARRSARQSHDRSGRVDREHDREYDQ